MKNLILITLITLSGAQASELILTVTPQAREILPGEALSVQLSVVNKGVSAISTILLLEEASLEIIETDPGEGAKAMTVPGRLMPEADYKAILIKPGESVSTSVVFVVNHRDGDYVFKNAGQYQIRARKAIGYREAGDQRPKQQLLESDGAAILVREPQGGDKRIWDEIKSRECANMFVSQEAGTVRAELKVRIKRLLEAHPESAYAPQLRQALGIAHATAASEPSPRENRNTPVDLMVKKLESERYDIKSVATNRMTWARELKRKTTEFHDEWARGLISKEEAWKREAEMIEEYVRKYDRPLPLAEWKRRYDAYTKHEAEQRAKQMEELHKNVPENERQLREAREKANPK